MAGPVPTRDGRTILPRTLTPAGAAPRLVPRGRTALGARRTPIRHRKAAAPPPSAIRSIGRAPRGCRGRAPLHHPSLPLFPLLPRRPFADDLPQDVRIAARILGVLSVRGLRGAATVRQQR